jgi:hypothetical protein
MSANFEILTERETQDIESCIYQFAHNNAELLLSGEISNRKIVVTVWFADMAREYLRKDTPDGEYCIVPKKVDSYSNPRNIDFINEFYETKTKCSILVEVVKKGAAKFFSVSIPDIFMGAFIMHPEAF